MGRKAICSTDEKVKAVQSYPILKNKRIEKYKEKWCA